MHMCMHIYMCAYIYYSMDTNWSICKEPSYQHPSLDKPKETLLCSVFKNKSQFLKKKKKYICHIYSFDLDPKTHVNENTLRSTLEKLILTSLK